MLIACNVPTQMSATLNVPWVALAVYFASIVLVLSVSVLCRAVRTQEKEYLGRARQHMELMETKADRMIELLESMAANRERENR